MGGIREGEAGGEEIKMFLSLKEGEGGKQEGRSKRREKRKGRGREGARGEGNLLQGLKVIFHHYINVSATVHQLATVHTSI